MTLDEARANIGAWVVHRPHGERPEDGTIVSVDDAFVFVRYQGERPTRATLAKDLRLPFTRRTS